MLIRTAEFRDVPQLVELEQLSWPEGLAADAKAIISRLSIFSAGQWIVEIDGQPAAYAVAQRVSAPYFEQNLGNYALLTDHGTLAKSHDPAGEIYHLIGVGVSRRHQGLGLARLLIDRQIETARGLKGVARILGVTRPSRYHEHASTPIETYVEQRSTGGRLIDPVLSFHLDNKARRLKILPGFRPEDRESLGYGVLIEYPMVPS